MNAIFTHNAFLTHDIEACAQFYTKFCQMRIVRDRVGMSHDMPRIIWLAPKESDSPIFVLAQSTKMKVLGEDSEPVMRHFGFDLQNRWSVDRLYRQILDAGLSPSKPAYWGPIAGYLFFTRDPDGRVVEFSAEQDVSPKSWDPIEN